MNWEHLLYGVISTVVFGLLGIALMLLGFKAFDWITPKIDLEEELAKNHNIAVAIVIAAVLMGVSLLVAHIVAA